MKEARKNNPDTADVRAFIGLGSNLGDRKAHMTAALKWIASHPMIDLKRHTEIVETEPWGFTEQPRFLNAVAEIETSLGPQELLDELKRAESDLGRKESATRWGPRVIDLDILLYGNTVIETDRLTVPHAQLSFRPFILEQMIDLDSRLVHPKLGVALKNLLRGFLREKSS